MTEPTKRGPGRPRKNVEKLVVADGPPIDKETEASGIYRPHAFEDLPLPESPETKPVPPGPLVLEVRLGPPGQGKIIFSQRVYAHTIDQQKHQAVITGALHPLKSDV